MTWTAFRMSPIDFGWDNLPTVEEAAAKIAADEAARVMAGFDDDTPGSEVAEFLASLATARKLAVEKGWEGDYRKGYEPRVCWIPAELRFEWLFV